LEHSYAATLSSLTTVTLGPPAVITFNLLRPSRTLDALLRRGHFRAHVLRADQDGASLAAAFVDGEHGTALAQLNERGYEVQVEELAGSTKGREFSPRFRRGALFAFDCEVLQDKVTTIGDHAVVFAAVRGAPDMDVSGPQESSLLYYFRDYGLAGRIPAAETADIDTPERERLAASKA
jgi:flavin reductase (DIM6/NTAB) family NADH-FMN oxidoreductase RutF